MLFGVPSLIIRGKVTLIISNRSFMNSIYPFGRFFGAKHPNKGTIAEMRDYEGWQYFLLILFHIVIYYTESVEFFVSCFANINKMLIKGKLIINSYT